MVRKLQSLIAIFGIPLLFLSCYGSGEEDRLVQRALQRFRDDYQGTGRVEPWTAKIVISPDGDWVVREIRDLSVEILPKAVQAEDLAAGIDWRGTVVIRYWSRVLEASAWRGPPLPSYWDQYASGYTARRERGKLVLDE